MARLSRHASLWWAHVSFAVIGNWAWGIREQVDLDGSSSAKQDDAKPESQHVQPPVEIPASVVKWFDAKAPAPQGWHEHGRTHPWSPIVKSSLVDEGMPLVMNRSSADIAEAPAAFTRTAGDLSMSNATEEQRIDLFQVKALLKQRRPVLQLLDRQIQAAAEAAQEPVRRCSSGWATTVRGCALEGEHGAVYCSCAEDTQCRGGSYLQTSTGKQLYPFLALSAKNRNLADSSKSWVHVEELLKQEHSDEAWARFVFGECEEEMGTLRWLGALATNAIMWLPCLVCCACLISACVFSMMTRKPH